MLTLKHKEDKFFMTACNVTYVAIQIGILVLTTTAASLTEAMLFGLPLSALNYFGIQALIRHEMRNAPVIFK